MSDFLQPDEHWQQYEALYPSNQSDRSSIWTRRLKTHDGSVKTWKLEGKSCHCNEGSTRILKMKVVEPEVDQFKYLVKLYISQPELILEFSGSGEDELASGADVPDVPELGRRDHKPKSFRT